MNRTLLFTVIACGAVLACLGAPLMCETVITDTIKYYRTPPAVVFPSAHITRPMPLHTYRLDDKDYSAARLAWYHGNDLTFGGRPPNRWKVGFITTHTVTLKTSATTITAMMRPGETMILEAVGHD